MHFPPLLNIRAQTPPLWNTGGNISKSFHKNGRDLKKSIKKMVSFMFKIIFEIRFMNFKEIEKGFREIVKLL